MLVKLLFVFAIVSIALPQGCYSGNNDTLSTRAKSLLKGRTVTIDPSFAPYHDRTAGSIAEEIAANGFTGVYYFVTSDRAINKEVITELQNRNIPVAMLLIASGAYLPTDERPQDWEKWRMEFTNDSMDSYKFMSFVYKDYVLWMKERIVRLIKEHGFDGVTFAEAMYPIANGLEKENVLYGDVSAGFQKIFFDETGNSVFPEFVNADSPNYYKRIPKVYSDLVQFRVKTINDFYDEIINGVGGVREECPQAMVATWTLGINLPDGVDKLREWEGNDIPSMIRQVRPDMHFIQTHAPDWLNPLLKPDYVIQYKPFFDAIRQTDSELPIAFQADFVSHVSNRRDPQWQEKFYKACEKMELDSTTYYVFSLRWDIYHEAPELVSGRVISSTKIELCFDQRLAKSCQDMVRNRSDFIISRVGDYRVVDAVIDGCLLQLELDKEIKSGHKVWVMLGGLRDDPEYRYTRAGGSAMPKGSENVIDEGVKKAIILD